AAYIAPECISDGRPSYATDQYSLAVAYVELRTGMLPIKARSIAAAYMAHLEGELDLSRLPIAECEVIRKATALCPSDRFGDVRSLSGALREAVAESERAGAVIAPLDEVAALEEPEDDEVDMEPAPSEAGTLGSRTMVVRDTGRGAEPLAAV